MQNQDLECGSWRLVTMNATFARKFLSINMFADFTSRWIYTGTACSWIYSRPLAESRAICTLVDHGKGSLPGIMLPSLLLVWHFCTITWKYHHCCWSYLFHANIGLSFHCQYSRIQGKETPQRNIQSTGPILFIKDRYKQKMI